MKEILKVGQPSPDFALPTPSGQVISLQTVRQEGRAVLLVFLRHLG